jgi:1,4-dihydroxy-2-naphthoyl-CoA hydrolase
MDNLEDKIRQIKEDCSRCMVSNLGIEFIEITPQKLVARMPVDNRTKQRFGILHGGASAALAETVASVAAWLNIDDSKFSAVGTELSISHLKSMSEGFVVAETKPFRIGRTMQVWDIQIKNESGQLIAVSRCSLAVIEKRK